ncbi:MAG TPA: hypothetical protein VF318_03910 [Dehalococcoidales bacterium]
MVLSRTSRVFLIVLDLALMAFIISDMVRGYSPVERPVFWIGAVIEIGLGYLTYFLWMRSTLGIERLRYQITAYFLIVVAVFVPLLIYSSHNSLLQPAETTERFYFVAVLTLLIYSSLIIRKYRAQNSTPKPKYQ